MAKPVSLPEWASDGTLIIEPAASLKATGWVNGVRPPAKYQNWYQERVYRWCEYLDGIESEALTWTVLQNFAAVTASGLVTASAGISTTTITASGLVTSTSAVQSQSDLGAYARLATTSDAGQLQLAEDDATYSATLQMPVGWDAAASASVTVDIPPQDVVTSIDSGPSIVSPGAEMAVISQGSWTPTIVAGSKTYVHQIGTWCRIGSMVVVEYDVQYNTGAGITSVAIGGLPYARSSSWRGLTAPTDAGPCGQVFDNTALVLYHGRMSGSTILVLDNTGASPAGGIAGHFAGQATYFTGP